MQMKFRSTIIQHAQKMLQKKGLKIYKTNEINRLTKHYWNVSIKNKYSNNLERIDSIVFSKNRALQLNAFIESYGYMVKNRGTLYILYKASDERHKKSYLELQNILPKEEYIFIEEIDFRNQFIEICEKSNAKILGLYVDDMIFLIKVDYKAIINIDMEECNVTLSRGRDLDDHPGRKLVLPEFKKRSDGFESFRWDYSDSYSHWTYPIGVSGYFYLRDEFLEMLKITPFKAPNSLESNLQKFVPLFQQRTGLCMHQISCVCVHANLVQTEVENTTIGTHTVEELLLKWEEGYKINLNLFYGITGKIAQDQTYSFIRR
jgi:hypothetical protein